MRLLSRERVFYRKRDGCYVGRFGSVYGDLYMQIADPSYISVPLQYWDSCDYLEIVLVPTAIGRDPLDIFGMTFSERADMAEIIVRQSGDEDECEFLWKKESHVDILSLIHRTLSGQEYIPVQCRWLQEFPEE